MKAVIDPPIPSFTEGMQLFDTYAEIEEIMKHPDFDMAGAEERDLFLGDTLIMSEGERHSDLKQLYAPLMSREAVAYYELHLVGPVIAEVLGELDARRGPDGLARVDAVDVLQAALTRISARVTGVDGVDTPERTDRFRELVLILSTGTTGSFTTDPVGTVAAGKKALQDLIDEFLKDSLARRVELGRRLEAGEITKEDLPRDALMTSVLSDDVVHPDDDEVEFPYIWRQCALFLTASIKTTSHSLPHVFVHLHEWIQEHPEDAEKLTDPEFLHRATAESFRLHQTAPVRFREATKDVTLSTGRKVAAGEMVVLRVPHANVSSEVFGEDGRLFDPYREVPKGTQAWGMTFGVGVHACLGRNLVTGIMNRGDARHGTHGTAVKVLTALYELGAELDPDDPPVRAPLNLHDTYERVPVILRGL